MRVQIFNIMGQLVRTLVNASQSAGRYDVLWDGRDMSNQPVPSGTYLCMLEAGSYRTFIKMTMAK
ncbi:MAG: flagellar basal body rod modification protein [bacterium ADurb.Bin478]|nr:MAG: flagellar basal body rod modification protein [bacterium ADurb.Bin478]